jgi:predicted RNA binding protein YcfA (HicA-like mRNA interferase family)
MPPPDALAFYLPFHYFFPEWWGIYLIAEGVAELARILLSHSQMQLTSAEAWHEAKFFLWGHEQYHHCVESFATRLEVTHRRPLYRCGFEAYYQRTAGKEEWIEESLANAYGFGRSARAFHPTRRTIVRSALWKYIEGTSDGYRQGLKYLDRRFDDGEQFLAEESHRSALPQIPAKAKALWSTFPHGFNPFRRINSRVCYLVHKDSSLAASMQLRVRYLSYRDLARRLEKIAGCTAVRQGKGSHEIWRTPTGRSFPVPRHPGDVARGTLAKIIKQAGLSMSVEHFVGAR